MREPPTVCPYQVCGGATCVTTVGVMGLSSCCWNAAPTAYSSTDLFSCAMFSASGPPTEENSRCAVESQPNWRTSFINCTGRVFTVSAASCSGVPRGLTAAVETLWVVTADVAADNGCEMVVSAAGDCAALSVDVSATFEDSRSDDDVRSPS
jgi:hypothetical protein